MEKLLLYPAQLLRETEKAALVEVTIRFKKEINGEEGNKTVELWFPKKLCTFAPSEEGMRITVPAWLIQKKEESIALVRRYSLCGISVEEVTE